MWETWVESLGWEDPFEKRKATHSSILLVQMSEGPSPLPTWSSTAFSSWDFCSCLLRGLPASTLAS